MIRFELPFVLPTLNEMLREGRHRRKKNRDRLAWAIVAFIGQQRPAEPIVRARIRVQRFGLRPVDPDNLTAKGLLDCLQPRSTRHPVGLGVIAEDNAAAIDLEFAPTVVVHHRVDQKTVVTIEEII